MHKAPPSPAPSPDPPAARRQRAGRLNAWVTLGLAAALLLAGCSSHRQVVSQDRAQKREVAVLSDQTPAKPPPSLAFAHLTALQVEASLRHVIVRPSKFVARYHGDPKPLFSPAQVTWARDAILAHLPGLRPDQRLQLSFRDRFNDFAVVVQLYGQGANLAYRFTELALEPPRPAMSSDSTIRLSWAKLTAQPGQQLHSEGDVHTLFDPIFSGPQARGQAVILDVLRREAKARHLPDDEVRPAADLLRQHPEISPETLRLYLDRLQLVDESEQQGLFTPQEAAARRQRLLRQLTPGGPAPAK